jgi:plasmid stability protein
MSAVTLRDLPPDLHEFLKADAAANHRSFNKQVIVALDAYRQQRVGHEPRQLTPEEKIARVREIQQEIQRVLKPDSRTTDEIIGYGDDGLFK